MVDISTPIKFRQVEAKSLFLDPRREYQLTEEKLQVRYDPLTRRTGHFARFGTIKPQRLPIESYSNPEVKGFCPFCFELRYKATLNSRNRYFPMADYRRVKLSSFPTYTHMTSIVRSPS